MCREIGRELVVGKTEQAAQECVREWQRGAAAIEAAGVGQDYHAHVVVGGQGDGGQEAGDGPVMPNDSVASLSSCLCK